MSELNIVEESLHSYFLGWPIKLIVVHSPRSLSSTFRQDLLFLFVLALKTLRKKLNIF